MKSPNLLLLHGALGSKAQLIKLAKELEGKYTVYSLNFEGHGGRSSQEDFSIELFANNVLAFLREHQISQTNIFGYSMGGYVALLLASQHPELVARMVTFGTKFDWNPEAARKEVKMLNPAVIEEKVPKFAAHLKSVHHPANWKEVLSKTANMMIALGDAPPLTPSELAKIDHRVLIGIGNQDNMVSLAESQATAATLRNGQLRILDGFQHPIEKNDLTELATVIYEFMDQG